jgi:molybdopterin synthase sulfur carrier subunit
MTSIKVKYFALFRELAGVESETLTVECETYRDLYQHVSRLHQFDLPVEMIQVAVDDEFTTMNRSLTEGARVVFIPPVAGG